VANRYLPIGERVRYRRRARGLSQLRLAALVDRTEDWVSKVERGEIPVDRISVLVKLADALKVPLSDLLGEQNLASEQAATQDETAGLRRVLSTVPAPATSEPRDLAALEADLLATTELRAQAHYAGAAAALPRLITDLEVTASSASQGQARGQALGLLSRAYGLAVATLVRYGEHDLAWVAADRGAHTAEPTGSPVERALAAYRLALAFVGAGRLNEAIYVVEAALERAMVAAVRSADLRSLRGALHLPLAIAQARKGDQSRAGEALHEAGRLAESGPDGRPAMSPDLRLATQYSPANVVVHRVSVAVDLADPGRALSLAPSVDPAGLSVSRYSRHLIDVAMAHNFRRDNSQLVSTLLEVERIAPEQLAHFPLVREMLHAALRRERGPLNAQLHGLAERVGAV
jgi:transcriptional regulator with XRE-family HTH domain